MTWPWKRKTGRRIAISAVRKVMRRLGLAILVATLLVCGFADWFVHHPREWIEAKSDSWPRFVVSALLRIGNPVGDMTDAIGFTGSDAIVEVESAAPSSSSRRSHAVVKSMMSASKSDRIR